MMRKASHTPRRGGFALIVAISLMVFVLLLTLSLSSFTMVETSTSVQQRAHARAQLNAKFGLMKAMAQLQEMAGPDQRVTAQASILDSDPSTTDIDGIDTAKYWTGVWNSEYPTNGGNPISVHQIADNAYNNLANRRADSDAANSRFLGWLVSGELDLTDARNYNPNDNDDALLLSNTDANENVYARKVAISDTDDTSLGLYAYWIDDEGVKAKFNIRDIHKEEAQNNDERRYSVMAAQRSGVENMTQLAQAGFPVNDGILNNMASSASLSSYYSAQGANDATLTTLAQDTIHDLTAYSYGLLTDPKHGGLKKDLTSYFEQATSTVPNALEELSFYVDTNYTFDDFELNEPRVADFPDPYNVYSEPGPTWKKLYSWYHLAKEYSVDEAIEPRPATDTQQGIGPIMIRAIVGFSPEVVPDTDAVTSNVYLRVHIDTKIVLWNPYKVALAPHDYEVEFMSGGSQTALFPQFVYDDSITNEATDAAQIVTVSDVNHYRGYYPNAIKIEHNNANTNGNSSASVPAMKGVFQHPQMSSMKAELGLTGAGVIFTIQDAAFEPGEVKVFSINNINDDAYTEGYTLSEGLYHGSVYLAYSDPLPSTVVDGVEVESKQKETDPNTGIETAKTEVRYPAFHWRPWDTTGTGAYNLKYSSPYGEIYGVGLREPIAAGEDRNIRIGGLVTGLNTYYSRQFRENLTRAEANEGNGSGNLSNFTARTTTPIFNTHFDTDTTRSLENDWSAGPNFKAKIEYNLDILPFDEGSPVTTANVPFAAAMIHWNPTAIESRRLGYTGGNVIPGLSSYNSIGWTSGVRYKEYGNITTVDVSGTNAFFGRSFSEANGLTHLPIMDAPQENQPILSLGFFQNANFNRQDASPGYQIGNSFPEIRLESLKKLYRDHDEPYYNAAAAGQGGGGSPAIVDSTYLLNDALWDRFFLSTYTDPEDINDANFTPPNARMTRVVPNETVPTAALNDFFDMAAAYLAVNGAFNVNSTSVEAWKATLGSLSDLSINGNTVNRVVSHYAAPSGDSNAADETNLWQGFRELTDDQLTALAEAMVTQVKTRGPFLSMGEFINRRLAEETDETSRRGAMQAAIEAVDYSGNAMSADGINATPASVFNMNDFTTDSEMDAIMYQEKAARTHRYAGVPGWVKQGDIIQALGPSLTVRSDTFRIRAYGETLDPITGDKIASAVCEAIVQRVPAPVSPNSTDADTLEYYEPSDTLGRKFEIVSFQWLPSDQI
ncbi:MAG: hypothetical protein Q7Q73_04540 [Verrucomicrobiota bacterium JB024]|nr:hypothetical protein [Verrucomicrobiota bacterium JB024]